MLQHVSWGDQLKQTPSAAANVHKNHQYDGSQYEGNYSEFSFGCRPHVSV